MIREYCILTDPKKKFMYKVIMDNIDYKQRQAIIKWIEENWGKYNEAYICYGWGLKENHVWTNVPELYFQHEEDVMGFKIRWL